MGSAIDPLIVGGVGVLVMYGGRIPVLLEDLVVIVPHGIQHVVHVEGGVHSSSVTNCQEMLSILDIFLRWHQHAAVRYGMDGALGDDHVDGVCAPVLRTTFSPRRETLEGISSRSGRIS